MDEIEAKGNGHDPGVEIALEVAKEAAKRAGFPGATAPLNQFEREDGIIAKAAEGMTRNTAGVLQRAMSAVEEDEHYRQLFKIAYWDNPAQYIRTCAALAECRLINDTEGIKMIVDVVTAQSAGIKGGLLHEILKALTHTTFTTNYQKGNYKRDHHDSPQVSD